MLCFLGNIVATYSCIILRALTCMVSTDVRETVGDRENRDCFDQTVSRRHFLTKSNINNIRVKVNDGMIKQHKDDPMTVTMMVSELKEEPFNPILVLGKTLGFPTLSAETFVLAIPISDGATPPLCLYHPMYWLNTWDKPASFQADHMYCSRCHGKGWRAHIEGNMCQGFL